MRKPTISCPVWCERDHRGAGGARILAHDVVISSHDTGDGTVTISLVWNERLDGQPSDPAQVAVRAPLGDAEPTVTKLTPEQADAWSEVLYVAGAPLWLVQDLGEAAAVIQPAAAGDQRTSKTVTSTSGMWPNGEPASVRRAWS